MRADREVSLKVIHFLLELVLLIDLFLKPGDFFRQNLFVCFACPPQAFF